MEKEIVWTGQAQKDFWVIVNYIAENWPVSVVNDFNHLLNLKLQLLQKHPYLGYKSTKYSRYRRTKVNRRYILIYSVNRHHIVVHRLKHASLL